MSLAEYKVRMLADSQHEKRAPGGRKEANASRMSKAQTIFSSD